MTKSDTIDTIMQLNPTATPEFLAEFTQDELGRYLARLQSQRRAASADRAAKARPGTPLSKVTPVTPYIL